MAPPSAFKPSPRQASGFWERGLGGRGHWFPELSGLPSASRGGQGCPAAEFLHSGEEHHPGP